MKTLLISLLFTSLAFANYAYTGQNSGKIDMHGGKSDKLGSSSGFGVAKSLGSVLNKKGSDKEIKKEEKNFMKIDKIEKIETKESK